MNQSSQTLSFTDVRRTVGTDLNREQLRGKQQFNYASFVQPRYDITLKRNIFMN